MEEGKDSFFRSRFSKASAPQFPIVRILTRAHNVTDASKINRNEKKGLKTDFALDCYNFL